MDMNSSVNAYDKEQLQVEETDDLSRVDFIGTAPLVRDIDGSCTTECVRDWSAEVKQENLAVKQEPDDVCMYSVYRNIKKIVQIIGIRLTFGTTLYCKKRHPPLFPSMASTPFNRLGLNLSLL